ncbi:hypothetical protein CPB84DRAFT_205942 [Gymnopilus junonius]|uniref:Uncharacterized protein n=1 Tax=Gymnopilus junonius TaxID=109634 RepID=A0A9P5TRW9_GYMJU|nr:hypothetical protein CPB84DRAFT_205942 [Gymnopilus junonius]
MSHHLLFTSLLLISYLTTNGRASRVVSHIIKDNDLRQYCNFELHDYHYNLCPLIDKTMLVEGVGTGLADSDDRGEISRRGRFYEVVLGGSSQWSQADVLSRSTCNENTWVCMLGRAIRTLCCIALKTFRHDVFRRV